VALGRIDHPWRVLGWEQIVAPQDAVPWLNQGLTMAAGRPAALCGEPGSRKSWWAMALLLSAAFDQPFLGRFPWRPGGLRCLYIDYEQGERVSRDRLARLAHGMGIAGLGDRLGYVFQPIEDLGRKNLAGAKRELTALVDGYDLVAIDSLLDCNPNAEENRAEISDPLKLSTKVSESTGCGFLFLDHATSKPAEGATRGSAQRGHSSKKGACSTLFVCSGLQGPVRVTCERSQNAPPDAWHRPYTWDLVSAPGGGLTPAIVEENHVNGVNAQRARAQSDAAAILGEVRRRPGLGYKELRALTGLNGQRFCVAMLELADKVVVRMEKSASGQTKGAHYLVGLASN
jgi:hypothetical protein